MDKTSWRKRVFAIKENIGIVIFILVLTAIVFYPVVENSIRYIKDLPYKKGDMSNEGGSPTYRTKKIPDIKDNPNTSDNESNDHPLGYFGNRTVFACRYRECNEYDIDYYKDKVERVYFEKGGWVDMDEDKSDCDLEKYCVTLDENGDEWEFNL